VTVADVCRGCAQQAVRPFFDLGELPLAGGFLDGEDAIAGEQRYPLLVSVCDNCGLVQVVDPIDADILFTDYAFKTGTIPGLVRHFDGYAGWIAETFAPASVVEFGANDGTLVAALGERGIRAIGVDLADNIVEMGKAEGRELIAGFFSRALVPELRHRLGGPAGLVTGSNVFAHNADPGGILEAADLLLTDDGVLALEVMYAGDLLELLQWDTLYHEHLTFYSLGTLTRLLVRYGFAPVEAERIPMHGGSLRVAARRVAAAEPGPSIDALAASEDDLALNDPATWDTFAADCRRRIDAFGDTMRRLSHDGATIWAYGAAGKATMWVNACAMEYLEAVVDASPLRAGKLMPGTHTPIVSPDEFKQASPDYVFVSAWNYLDAIRGSEPQYDGYWIVPLPEMRIQ
jgi:SAM-dependent methyltransferase